MHREKPQLFQLPLKAFRSQQHYQRTQTERREEVDKNFDHCSHAATQPFETRDRQKFIQCFFSLR
jgi:hypothetical protein